MLFSPLINAGIEFLLQDKKKLLSAWVLYALAMVLNWSPLYFMTGADASGWGNHTFNTILFMYVTLRVVRI